MAEIMFRFTPQRKRESLPLLYSTLLQGVVMLSAAKAPYIGFLLRRYNLVIVNVVKSLP
jgi:hypothetical protein